MKSLVIIVLVVSLLFLTAGCVFNIEKTYQESKVDASPLAELSSEDIGRMLDVIDRMEKDGIISERRLQKRPGAAQLLEIHSFNWNGEDSERLMASVYVFETEQGAIDYSSSDSEHRNSQQHIVRVTDDSYAYTRPYTFILYDNGAEARLGDSGAIIDEYRTIIHWSMNTGVRLENYRITMTEHRYSSNFDDPAAGMFIRQLVDMLQDTAESPIS